MINDPFGRVRGTPELTGSDASGPIFLLASERSGTNLLRRILRANADVDGPSPTHLMDWLSRVEPYYGDLRIDQNFRTLVEDSIRVATLPLQPWQVELSVDDALATLEPESRSLARVLAWMNDRHAQAAGKRRWFAKDRKLAHHAYELGLAFPSAKFIYMARDPRDVFASYKKTPGGPKHPHPFATEWAHDQDVAIRAARSSVLRSRTLELTYEMLVAEPEHTARQVCVFLGLEYTDEMISASAGAGLDTSSPFWQNLDKDIMRGNSGQYRTALTRSEIRVVEERAWAPMQLLGYAPEVAGRAVSVGRGADLVYRVVGALRAKRAARGGSEVDHQSRRRRQEFRRSLASRFPAMRAY